jgi:hypothetical protein
MEVRVTSTVQAAVLTKAGVVVAVGPGAAFR